MRIIVTKPEHGTTKIVIDDRRGATGQQTILEGVPVDNVGAALEKPLGDWKVTRDQIKALRKRKSS